MPKSNDNEEYVKWWEHWMSQVEQHRVIVKHSSSKVEGAGLKSGQKQQKNISLPVRGGAKDRSNQAQTHLAVVEQDSKGA